jgi:exonuclease SbcC
MAGDIVKLEVKLDERENGIRILRDSVSSKNSRMLFLRDQIKEAKLKISASRENELKLKKLEKLLGDEPDKKIGVMLDNVEALKKKLYSMMAEKNEVEKSLDELKEAGEKCPVCESRITEEKKKGLIDHRLRHIGDIDLRIHEVKERLAKENAKAEEFRKSVLEYAELKRDLKDLDSLKEKIIDDDEKITLLMKEVKGIVHEIRKKEKDEKNLRLLLEKMRLRASKAGDMLKDKEELDILAKEKRELRKELTGLAKQIKVFEKKLHGKDIKSMRLQLQEANRKSGSMETKIRDMAEMLKDKKSVYREVEEQAATLARYRKDSERYGKITDSMDIFISVLRSTQDHLRDEFLRNVNSVMNDVWDELYPYGDFSEIRMLVDKDYVLQLRGSKGWMNAEIVSGGERSLACLALRIAFSLSFTPNLRWLILDEPTHNLDANAIEHFGSVLKDRMENIIEQVFLITHEERLSDYITGYTYKLERDKEADGVTKIVEYS